MPTGDKDILFIRRRIASAVRILALFISTAFLLPPESFATDHVFQLTTKYALNSSYLISRYSVGNIFHFFWVSGVGCPAFAL
jgi:hypothetical protein